VTALGFFLFFAMLAMTVVATLGTNAELYRSLQEENGLPGDANLTGQELQELDEMLAAYLGGDAAALDNSPFQPHEQAHMRDVFALFSRLRTLRNLFLPASLVLLAVGAWMTRLWRFTGACLAGLGVFVLPLIAFGVWAAADFSGAFNFFHRLLFDNLLWQLDPAKDLLLQICPERFFSDFAAVLAVRVGLYILAVPLAVCGIRIGRKFT